MLRAVAWVLPFSIAAVILQGSQWPSLLLPPKWKHAWIRQTEKIFGSIILMLTYAFFPTTFGLSGEVSKYLSNRNRKTVVFANHQNFLDWWYLWHLAWMQQRHGDVKIVLRGDLKNVPIFGLGCSFFDFVWVKFGSYKGKDGQSPLVSFNETIKRYLAHPFWFLIFPEGTLLYPNNIQKCREFAKANSLPFEQELTLLPKHAGLYSALQILNPETVWDLTISYSDVLPSEMPFDVFPVPLCFFRPPLKGGARFNVHIREVPVSSIPGFGGQPGSAPLKPAGASGPYSVAREEAIKLDAEGQFSLWLRELWLEKERRKALYYKAGWKFGENVDAEVAKQLYGSVPTTLSASERKEIPIVPKFNDFLLTASWLVAFGWAGWIGTGFLAANAVTFAASMWSKR